MKPRKQTPIYFAPHLVAKIIDGTKTMAMEPVRERWVHNSDGIGKRDESCPFGDVGDWLSIHPFSTYGPVVMRIDAIRKIEAGAVTDDDAKRMGYESVADFYENDSVGRALYTGQMWVCEFKLLEATP